MDVKQAIGQIVEKAKSDPALLTQFASDPEKALESVLGVDIPDGAADEIIKGVKEKLPGGKVADLVDKVKGLL